MPSKTETVGCKVKETEIWDSGTLVTYICATFDLVVFNFRFGSFSTTCALYLRRDVRPSRIQGHV